MTWMEIIKALIIAIVITSFFLLFTFWTIDYFKYGEYPVITYKFFKEIYDLNPKAWGKDYSPSMFYYEDKHYGRHWVRFNFIDFYKVRYVFYKQKQKKQKLETFNKEKKLLEAIHKDIADMLKEDEQ